MEKIITADGSITFRNENVDETYHTKSGAEEESVKKFVEPSHFEKLAERDEIVIYDVCFGLGYNSAAAIDHIRDINSRCKIIIYALENDQNILDKILEIDSNFKCYQLIKEIVKSHNIKENNVEINLLFGDAREKINNIDKKADAVFFDPFSPKKAPDMWTKEFFAAIYNKMRMDGILTTYSCARMVRDNLKSAGFQVHDGPTIGRRSPSTIAIKRDRLIYNL